MAQINNAWFSTPSLANAPNEILSNVFKYLTPSQLREMRLVRSDWDAVARRVLDQKIYASFKDIIVAAANKRIESFVNFLNYKASEEFSEDMQLYNRLVTAGKNGQDTLAQFLQTRSPEEKQRFTTGYPYVPRNFETYRNVLAMIEGSFIERDNGLSLNPEIEKIVKEDVEFLEQASKEVENIFSRLQPAIEIIDSIISKLPPKDKKEVVDFFYEQFMQQGRFEEALVFCKKHSQQLLTRTILHAFKKTKDVDLILNHVSQEPLVRTLQLIFLIHLCFQSNQTEIAERILSMLDIESLYRTVREKCDFSTKLLEKYTKQYNKAEDVLRKTDLKKKVEKLEEEIEGYQKYEREMIRKRIENEIAQIKEHMEFYKLNQEKVLPLTYPSKFDYDGKEKVLARFDYYISQNCLNDAVNTYKEILSQIEPTKQSIQQAEDIRNRLNGDDEEAIQKNDDVIQKLEETLNTLNFVIKRIEMLNPEIVSIANTT